MPLTPPTTPRFGAPRPANTDTFDIERDVTAGFDKFDLAAKFTSSLSTARPTSPVVDQYNYSTDTDVLERWNGTAWVRPTPAPHASSHQDGGTDALTVREAMMATGTLGLAKGAFSAYRNAAATITATSTDVIFDTEEYDVSNWYNPATGVYTPQVAGIYRFSWLVSTSGAPTADSQLAAHLYRNGTRIKAGKDGVARSTNSISSGLSATATANGTTDAFKIQVANTSGSIAMRALPDFTFFQGELVGRS